MDSEAPSGKAKGGLARAQALSPERRREIALQGVVAKRERAASREELAKLPKATHEGVLDIGGRSFLAPCSKVGGAC
jgi:hypothetical protein